MRLIDNVVQSSASAALSNDNGEVILAPGVGAKAGEVENCALRYILDRSASEQCIALVRGATDGLFDPESELLRMPAEDFWVEWFSHEAGRPRVALLVQSAEGGREGTISGFFEDEVGRADTVPAVVEFNLDCESLGHASRGRRISHEHYLHLNNLLSCASLHLAPEWEQYFRARDLGNFERTVRDVAANCWYFLPVACAFAAMLNSSDVLSETQSDLSRLNATRIRRGAKPLLDHLEVTLHLGNRRDVSSSDLNRGGKTPPRLHHVRGHFVQRGSKTFWRSPHLRGDADRPIIQKTVRVNAAPRFAAVIAQSYGTRGL